MRNPFLIQNATPAGVPQTAPEANPFLVSPAPSPTPPGSVPPSVPQTARASHVPSGVPEEGVPSHFPMAPPEPEPPSKLETAGKNLLGLGEVAATMGTGAATEIMSGLAGIGGLAAHIKNPDSDIPSRLVKGIQQDTYLPQTQSGQEMLQGMAKVVEPISRHIQRAEKELGDTVYELTGKPGYAAMATTIPTAVAELVSGKAATTMRKFSRAIKKQRLNGDVISNVGNAVPTVEQLMKASDDIMEDLMFTRISADKTRFRKMVSNLEFDQFYQGMDPRTTKQARSLIDAFKASADDFIDFREFSVLRDMAKNLAEKPGANGKFGQQALRELDQFAAGDGNMHVKMPDGSPADKNVAELYSASRSLKRRALRSQYIEDAFENARGFKSGLENGLATEMKKIVNNPIKRDLFNKSELHQMREIIKGSSGVNFARFLGNFDIVGKSPSLYGIFGLGDLATKITFKSMVVPFIGRVGNALANRLIQNKARFADKVIRAGSDAGKIAQAYIENTPKLLREPQELAQLILRPDVALDTLDFADPLIDAAASIAAQQRAALAGAMAPPVAQATGEQYAPSY